MSEKCEYCRDDIDERFVFLADDVMCYSSGAYNGQWHIVDFNFCPMCGKEIDRELNSRDDSGTQYCTDQRTMRDIVGKYPSEPREELPL